MSKTTKPTYEELVAALRGLDLRTFLGENETMKDHKVECQRMLKRLEYEYPESQGTRGD